MLSHPPTNIFLWCRLFVGLCVALLWVASACVTVDVPLYPDATAPSEQPLCNGRPCPPDTPPTCPQTCLGDRECGPCGIRFLCVAGACKPPPPPCKTDCLDDRDCAGCQDGHTSCAQGKCEKPKPLLCLALCSDDDDCNGCPDKRIDCVKDPTGQGRCTPDGGSLCPETCRGPIDCQSCLSGRTFCRPPMKGETTGVCLPPPPRCDKTCNTAKDCGSCAPRLQNCLGFRCGGPTCNNPGDCNPDEFCVQNRCSFYDDKPCRESTDCRPGERCLQRRCVP